MFIIRPTTTVTTCHQCGSPLPPGSSAGTSCPACLWDLAATPAAATEVTPGRHASAFPHVEGHTILRELARGGMGIVYKAQQHTPEREVALKMLLPFEDGREDLRERFRVEISALAGLDHPGILPLYQSGSADGRPWFTMKLAAGGTLHSRIARQRGKLTAPRDAASLIALMADAVHHAHTHGFLHRDIKPANILFDERGDPFLADFGLAKLLDSTSGDGPTHSQAVLGTPCYMAPEVAMRGAAAATTASDTYGLGAVLYELLSGRPPFIVEGYAALVKKIAEEEPARLTTLTGGIPRDLDIICHTCLAKDPRQRYPSAKEAADDLRRYLRGEPINARRTTTVTRLLSWARRRPAIAALTTALTLTFLTASVWITIAYYQLRRSQTAEAASRARADEQSEFLIGSFTDQLEKMGRLSLIEDACTKAAALDDPIDDAGHKRRARLLLRWASALWAKGDGTAAAPKLREAIQLLDQIQSPPDPESANLLLRLHTTLAEVLAETSTLAAGTTLLDTADQRIGALSSLPLATSLQLKATLSRSRAILLNRQKDGDSGGLAPARRALDLIRAWAAESPAEPARPVVISHYLETLTAALLSRARDRHRTDEQKTADATEALAICRESIALLEPLLASPEAPAAAALAHAEFHDGAAAALRKLGPERAAEALTTLEKAVSLYHGLTLQDPLNIEWLGEFANASRLLSIEYKNAGRPEDSTTQRDRQRTALEAIHLRAPQIRRWALSHIDYLVTEARAQLDAGDKEAAARQLDQALAIALDRVQRQPASRTEQNGWRDVVHNAALVWLHAGEDDRAITIYRAHIATAAAATGPDAGWWQWTGASLRRRLCDVYDQRKDYPSALAENLLSLQTRRTLLLADFPPAVADAPAIVNSYGNVIRCHVLTSGPPAALRTIAEALDTYTACGPRAGPPAEWAIMLAMPLKRLATEPAHAAEAQSLATRALSLIPPGTSADETSTAAMESLKSTAAGESGK